MSARSGLGGAIITLLPLLAGCATLPSNGPTMTRVYGEATRDGIERYRIADISAATVDTLNAPVATSEADDLSTLTDRIPAGVIAPGDVLQIAIYEIGVSLFSGNGNTGALAVNTPDYTAHSEKFANVMVDQDGSITLPYIGRVVVAENTAVQAQKLIQQGLIGASQSPQVLVSISESTRNSAYVAGDIRRPGKILLSPAGDRLLNVLATAGGSANQPYDVVVRIVRGEQSRSVRLSALDAAGASNILVGAGDYIDVIRKPQTFTILGASNKVAQIPFEAERISLAEAIAKAGGLNDNQADPKAVFLFRNKKSAENGAIPVVYRLNLMDPQAYFLAQDIYVQDSDLIYVANARANLPTKFVSIMNQLFSPLVTFRALSN